MFFKNFRIFPGGWVWLVVLLACAGGAAALGHQVLWTRRMVDLLGASAGSSARVFGCFFLGLALGAMAGAWLAGRVRRPWRWLGGAEVALALLCVPMLSLPWWADGLWPWLGPAGVEGWRGGAVKTGLSVLLVLPPAAMMGFFLPLAVAGWPGRSSGDPGLWLYAVNTLGAVGGVVGVTVLLLPRWGLVGSMAAAIVINLAVAAGCLLLDAVRGPGPVAERRGSGGSRPQTIFLVLAGLSGALVMGVEVLALSVLQLVAPLSLFAPAAVLGVFIALLAGAALAVAGWPGSVSRWATARWVVPLVAGLFLAAAPLVFHALAPVFPVAVESASLAGFLGRLALFTLAVFGPAVLVAGLWFPLLASASAAGLAEARLRWGWLLAANGVGGLIGAEAAYGLVLPWLGPFGGLGLSGFFYVLAAWVLRPAGAGAWWAGGALAGVVCLMVWVLPGLPVVHRAFAPAVVAQWHGREGSLVVLEQEGTGRSLLVQNQYFLGSSGAAAAQERQAHVPLLLHPEPRRVAFLGMATGITPGGALRHGAVEELVAVEISGTVVQAAGAWFGPYNRGLMEDARARVVVEDARTWLAAHDGEFDAVVSDLFLPWGPGEGRLYSLEHFHAARRALREGGLFCLWLPVYQLTQEQFMVILGTFLEVFPRAELFRRDADDAMPVVGLVGWRGGGLDWEVAAGQQAEMAAAGEEPLLGSVAALRDRYLGGVEHGAVQAPVNTLGNLWIEWQAGRMRALQPETAPYLSGVRGAAWLRALAEELSAEAAR